jgi:spore coat polysaccharide biosynthesis protein SpsF (cytidylyltransferase family)
LRFIPVPARLDRSDVRLTVDLEEDWELAQIILEALGPEGLDWHRIASLLDQQPGLRERMAGLNETTVRS